MLEDSVACMLYVAIEFVMSFWPTDHCPGIIAVPQRFTATLDVIVFFQPADSSFLQMTDELEERGPCSA